MALLTSSGSDTQLSGFWNLALASLNGVAFVTGATTQAIASVGHTSLVKDFADNSVLDAAGSGAEVTADVLDGLRARRII